MRVQELVQDPEVSIEEGLVLDVFGIPEPVAPSIVTAAQDDFGSLTKMA